MKPRLSVITVTWNSAEWITRQIRSVQASCCDIAYEQIVVDNASTDRTVQAVSAFPTVHFILNGANAGFAAANNAAYAQSQGEYLLFLNPDMELTGDMAQVVAWMDAHCDVAVAGGLLRHGDGTLNRDALPRRFPTLRDLCAVAFKLGKLFPDILDNYLYRDRTDWTTVRDVDTVRGSCLLLRRELAEHCGWAFDPRYFIWFEDVDICHEAAARGQRVAHLPLLTAVDHFGRSFKQRNMLWKQGQFNQSMFLYATKWLPLHAAVMVGLLTWPVRMAGKLSG